MMLDLGIFVAVQGFGAMPLMEKNLCLNMKMANGNYDLSVYCNFWHVHLHKRNLKARPTLHEVSIDVSEYSAPQNLKIYHRSDP